MTVFRIVSPITDTDRRATAGQSEQFTGVATDLVVALAARSAHPLGYHTTVIPDTCAGTSTEAHEHTLTGLAGDGTTVIRDRHACVGVHSNA
ncbi:isochorismatase family protein [Rhodococcus sp. ABRD24]|nr:isochorismatase family protein [Rhodococcus sp. ABRD24]